MEELDELGNVVVPASSICNDLNNTYRLDKNGVEDRGCFVDDGFGIGKILFTLFACVKHSISTESRFLN